MCLDGPSEVGGGGGGPHPPTSNACMRIRVGHLCTSIKDMKIQEES